MVLLVEGVSSQFDELEPIIEKAGFVVRKTNDIANAMFYTREYKPSLVLSDLAIQDKDAIDLLRDFEQYGLMQNGIVVILSERKERYVEIAALNAGADDYLIKPVNNRLFASKLQSWFRRRATVDANEPNAKVQLGYNLDKDRFSILLPVGEIPLQRKEFEIVSLLTSKPRKIFTRVEIKESIWGKSAKAKERTIDVHITNLRSKIGAKSIKTHKGKGYSFNL